MPPRKRKAASAASAAISTVSAPRKKVRIGDESVIGEDGNTRDSTPASTGSGRAMRATANESPQYNFTKTRGGSKSASASSSGNHVEAALPTRGRGRLRGSASAGRGRGRPGVKRVSAVEPEVGDEPEVEPDLPALARKGILKNRDSVVDLSGSVGEDTTVPTSTGRARGRPRKSGVDMPKNVGEDTTVSTSTGRGRGRPRRSDVDLSENVGENTAVSTSTGRGRGRPRKSDVDTTVSVNTTRTTPETNVASKGRGRPKKANGKLTTEEMDGLTDEEAFTRSAASPDIDAEIQYWLMKAEPDSRMEKGVDVKFSIDDLASRTEPEGWDGVRNPVARNNMRAMRRGDLAFFYHSNCKVPGIVGVMRIVEEHQIDESAFDPDHPYYDAKSDRSKPKWEMVKVEFVKKFDDMLTLRDLKSFAAEGGKLANMQMLKQSRLSVSSVKPEEWLFILEQLGEEAKVGQPDRIGGYEGDTDGEGDDPVAEMPDADSFAQSDVVDSGVGTGEGQSGTVVSLGDVAPGEVTSDETKITRTGFRKGDWDADSEEGLGGPD